MWPNESERDGPSVRQSRKKKKKAKKKKKEDRRNNNKHDSLYGLEVDGGGGGIFRLWRRHDEQVIRRIRE